MDHRRGESSCRSLVCDSNGIIVAETVYRCMLCSEIFESILESKHHYYECHVDDSDDEELRRSPSPSPFGSSLSQTHPNVVRALNRDPIVPSIDRRTGGFHMSHHRNPNHNNHHNHEMQVAGGRGREAMDVNLHQNHPEVIDESAGNAEVAVGKAGYVKCAVCGVIRYYSCVYRRYGHFTCQVCYRFFRTFFTKPKRYFCPTLGKCLLNVRVRCRACWLLSCINLYTVDPSRRALIDQYYPREYDDSLQTSGWQQQITTGRSSIFSIPPELSPLSQSPPPEMMMTNNMASVPHHNNKSNDYRPDLQNMMSSPLNMCINNHREETNGDDAVHDLNSIDP